MTTLKSTLKQELGFGRDGRMNDIQSVIAFRFAQAQQNFKISNICEAGLKYEKVKVAEITI
jgi:hypothetical protein